MRIDLSDILVESPHTCAYFAYRTVLEKQCASITPGGGGLVPLTTYPDFEILFTSRYTDDAIAHQGVLETGVEFLPKPHTPTTLTRKVREMLDDPSAYPSEMEEGVASNEGISGTP